MATSRRSQPKEPTGRQSPLFDSDWGSGDGLPFEQPAPDLPHSLTFKAFTPEATEVTERTLRSASGELRQNVRHPVEIAYFLPKRGKLGLLSNKLWIFIVSYTLANPGTRTDEGLLWRVNLTTLENDTDWNSKDRETLKEAIRECQRTLVEWSNSARNPKTNEVQEWASTQLLGSVEFVLDEKGRRCLEWTLPPTLLRQLREHTAFFESSLAIVTKFRRASTLSLYRITSRYKTNRGGYTMRKPWREWIPILTGVSNEEARHELMRKAAKKGLPLEDREPYPEWRYFHRDIVKKAVKELNAVVQEYWVQPIFHKLRGGEVAELQFQVIMRAGFKPSKPAPELSEAMAAVHALQELGLTNKFAQTLCAEYSSELCLEVARSVAARVADGTQKRVENVPGFLLSEIKKAAAVKAAKERPVETRPPMPVSSDEAFDAALSDYRAQLVADARKLWTELPDSQRLDYTERFKQENISHASPQVQRVFAKDKEQLKSPLILSRFYPWLAEQLAGGKWAPSDRELLAFERNRATKGKNG